MSDYEDKKQARIDRYRARAEQARAQSTELYQQSHDMISVIPMGQPIMGARDRRYRERAAQKMDKSMAAMDKAEYYERKAEAAENNTAISSDDPDAIAKLTEKLESLQIMQTRMKQINAYYRKNGTCRGFHGLTDEEADKLISDVQYHPWDRSPYPAFALSNNSAEIRRLKGRIQKLTEAKELGYQGWEFDGGRVVPNEENNRLQIFFDEIPNPEVRQELKSQGFRWARSEGAWQRQLTDNAIYAARRIEAIWPADGSDPIKIQPKRKPGPKH